MGTTTEAATPTTTTTTTTATTIGRLTSRAPWLTATGSPATSSRDRKWLPQMSSLSGAHFDLMAGDGRGQSGGSDNTDDNNLPLATCNLFAPLDGR